MQLYEYNVMFTPAVTNALVGSQQTSLYCYLTRYLELNILCCSMLYYLTKSSIWKITIMTANLSFQDEYKREKIDWQNISFTDNRRCLDLFAKRPSGLFFLLDEEGK